MLARVRFLVVALLVWSSRGLRPVGVWHAGDMGVPGGFEARDDDPAGAILRRDFMNDFWQQRPLLVRGAFPSLARTPILDGDELAGLACDEDASARLIVGAKFVEHGPFDDEDFARLSADASGRNPWSLLVNDVERLHSPAHAIVEAFSFIPTWRHDDCMVSFAEVGGIGAHVDSYDVFLVQGLGKREWSIMGDTRLSAVEESAMLVGGNSGGGSGSDDDDDDDDVEEVDVRTIRDDCFSPSHSWVLQPGDMLYLPPRVPHRGSSLPVDSKLNRGSSTISVGFRVPSEQEMVAHFAEFVCSDSGVIPEGAMFNWRDAGSEVNSDGHLHPRAVKEARSSIKRILLAALEEDKKGSGVQEPGRSPEDARNDAFSDWFGSFVTRPQRGQPLGGLPPVTKEEEGAIAATALEELGCHRVYGGAPKLMRQLGAKFVYLEADDDKDVSGGTLFVDGVAFPYTADCTRLVYQLCKRCRHQRGISAKEVLRCADATSDRPNFRLLLGALLARGFVYLDDPESDQGH
jgi:50S ribosomal protein L16 3-hydroxylase